MVLFDRRRSGYIATHAGTEVIALARNIELEIIGVSTRISDREAGHAGDLRITTSDSLAYNLIVPIVAAFRAENPGIRVEVLIANNPFNLARGESDIAIRATSAPPENLLVERWRPSLGQCTDGDVTEMRNITTGGKQ